MGEEDSTEKRRKAYSTGRLDLISLWQSGGTGKYILLMVDEPVKTPLQLAFQENVFKMDAVDIDDFDGVRAIEDRDKTRYDAMICLTSPEKMHRAYSSLEKIASNNTKPLMTVIFSQQPGRLHIQYINNGRPQNGKPRITEVHEQVEQIVREVLCSQGYLKLDSTSKMPLTHAELTNRLKQDPKNPRLRFQAGLFYAREGLMDLAARNYFAAIEFDPNNQVLTSVEEDPRAALAELIQLHPDKIPAQYRDKIDDLTSTIEKKSDQDKLGDIQKRVIARKQLAAGDPDRAIQLIGQGGSIDNILLLLEAYTEKFMATGDQESRETAFKLVEEAESSSFYASGSTVQVGMRLPRITGFNTLWIGEPIKRGRGRIVIKRYEREHIERAKNETDNVNVLSRQEAVMLNGKKLNFADYAMLLEKEGAEMVYIIMPLIKDPETGRPAKGMDILAIPDLQRSEQLALAELLTDAESAIQDSALKHRDLESFRDAKYTIELPSSDQTKAGFYTRLFVEEVLPFYESAGLNLKDNDKKILAELWQQEIDQRLSNTLEIFYRPFFDNRIENTLVTFPKGANQDPTLRALLEHGILHRIDLEKGARRHFLTDEFMAWGHEWLRKLSHTKDYASTMRYLTTRKVAEILLTELPAIRIDPGEIKDALWLPGEMLDASSIEIGDARSKLEKITRKYLDMHFSWDIDAIFDQVPIADAERHIVVAAYQRKRLREYKEHLMKDKYDPVRTIDSIAKVQAELPRLSAENIDLFKELCTLNTFVSTQESHADYHQAAARSALLQAGDNGEIKNLIRRLSKAKIITTPKKKK
ncbi:hypothetical protein KY338_06450 [Candidatus Woesearchaeota archaeon]|nr:hypothetical protein [Candidatus Woesearchaeota archaeon]MBW3006463.1 hypothetical protein [Candidatus Woesearchaeota archaeon]